MKLAIIIPLFKGKVYISDLLETIVNQTFTHISIFAVDNNPEDGTAQELSIQAQKYSIDCQIFPQPYNGGFAKAINIGLQKAIEQGFSHFVFLNQDVVLSSDVFEQGIHALQNTMYGAVVPKILHIDNRIWWVGTHIFSAWRIVLSLSYKISEHLSANQPYNEISDTIEEQEIKPIEAITGCALFITKPVIEKVGYLDERYFMYGEDLDYSLRIKKAGYTLGLLTKPTVYHRDQYALGSKILSDHIKSITKYRIYLTSCFVFLHTHYSLFVALIWSVKLPITLGYQYIAMKIKS
ncbi:MAG: hypothetical protein RJB24_488 [Candidatus Parcubacteria bacterium]|jgi:GT2 family glycosyltransferase